ncbi:hypothetical protein PQR70_41020 [Paraburkholderia madseniana]|uniref:hypothetical protein n=1 Tax=Paraburkholderia madseniana TaxID=2599607 RepID=UPI0038B796E5
MQPRRISRGRRPRIGIAPSIDQPLNMDMRDRFLLQVTLLGFGRKVVGKCPVDVARMSVVTLDQIRVIAVHRTDEVTDRVSQDGMNSARQLIRFCHERQDVIVKKPRCLIGNHRSHACRIHGNSVPDLMPD